MGNEVKNPFQQIANYGLQLVKSPSFWAGFFEVAAQQTEKASPNFTIAHQIAATVDHLLTGGTISTPDKSHEEPLIDAISEGIKRVVTGAVSTSGTLP